MTDMNEMNHEMNENIQDGNTADDAGTGETAGAAAPEAEEEQAIEVVGIEAYDEEPAPEDGEEQQTHSFVSDLFDYVEILVFSVAAVLLVFTLAFRLCRVDGSSMRNTLHDNEMLITTSLVDPKPGDIIVFHMTSETYDHFNEPLVKRIIAVGGQTVRYDYSTMEVFVDGEKIDDGWAHYLDQSGQDIGKLTQYPMYGYDAQTKVFETTVPEGKLFVMGDNRNHSSDSRTIQVGYVDERQVLGKVIANLGDANCGGSARK